MIKKIRSIARGIGSKILMALLILTFAVWGVGDIVNGSNSNVAVATVGDIKITQLEYQRTLYYEKERLQKLFGKELPPEIIRSLGIETQALQRLVDNRLLLLEARNNGLRVGDEDVANNIRKNPLFMDSNGKFSKDNFINTLRSTGHTEKDYVDQIREDLAVKLLVTTLVSAPPIPENIAPTLFLAREEKRIVDIYKIPSTLIKTIPTPNENQLKEYYDSHITEFTAPEYRKLSYILLTEDDVKNSIKSNSKANSADKDIETAYHERINEFKVPEKRKIERLIFANEGDARKAYDSIKAGESFEQIAGNSNILNQKATSLGVVEKSSVLESAAEKVFALDVGAISEPINSAFGWHIFHVEEIYPATTKPLEDVRQQLETELNYHANEKALIELTNKIEDSIAGGNTLGETAKELALKTISLPPIDKNGVTLDGATEKNLPNDEKFLEIAFKTDEKTESSLITGKDGINYILRVESIKPESVYPLEDVKSKLVLGWTKKEKEKQLATLAKKIAADFTTESARIKAIETYSLSVPEPLLISQKKDDNKVLQAATVKEIFARSIGEATNAFSHENNNSYIIAVVKKIIPAKSDEKDPKYISALADINKEYESSLQNEVIEQYLRFLANKYPISINMSALKIKSDE
ncbi:MAG: SurA N-terminal domain-containing protein [Rickettsiales bacterium]|jgi:peptidyl-prolyl cis-trans isomerase D